jgi:hypothetical protein
VREGRRPGRIRPVSTGEATTLGAVFPPWRGGAHGSGRRPGCPGAHGILQPAPRVYATVCATGVRWGDARLTLAPSAGQQDRLAPVTEATVGGRLAGVCQCRLFRGCQLHPQHFASSLSPGHEPTGDRVPQKRCNITRRLSQKRVGHHTQVHRNAVPVHLQGCR